jgi:hypothetical protein
LIRIGKSDPGAGSRKSSNAEINLIRDPGSGKKLFRNQMVKKAPDPGSKSATLLFTAFEKMAFVPTLVCL